MKTRVPLLSVLPAALAVATASALASPALAAPAALAAPVAPAAPSDDVVAAELTALLGKLGVQRAAPSARAVASVQKQLARFLAKPTLAATWERKQKAWPTIARALQAEGLPEEIGYLAWAESGFRADAASSGGSKGVWQFIPATARKYGLKVEGATDERLDLEKDTRAAARYLKKLIDEFDGAPLLAIAAYNQGEAAVRRVVGAAPAEHAKDFFWLAEQGALNEEGAAYVPRFLAAALIGTHAERYGLR